MKRLLLVAGTILLLTFSLRYFCEAMIVDEVPAISLIMASPQASDPYAFTPDTQAVLSQKTRIYKAYAPKTGELIDMSYMDITSLSSGEKIVRLKVEGNENIDFDEYLLDAEYDTQSWRISVRENDTEYIGERQGDELHLNGKFNGKPLSKELKLDDKPFYYNPKISLSKFAQSDDEHLQFWALRNDTLTIHKMEAFKRGTETVTVNGEEVEAVKVYWAADGPGAKFFNRMYLFRKSDGAFILQEPSPAAAWMMELINEQQNPTPANQAS